MAISDRSAHAAGGTLVASVRSTADRSDEVASRHARRRRSPRSGSQTDGYTIIEDAIDLDELDALAADLRGLEEFFDVQPATNGFEGTKTLRVYNLLAYGARFEAIPVHPNVLPIVEGVLDPGCLISSLSSITILPGERAQPIHADDQLIPLAKPHVPTVCNTMWALTDFTEANGATRIIPGTHRFDHSPDLFTDVRLHPGRDAAGQRARVARLACGTAAARTRPTRRVSASR